MIAILGLVLLPLAALVLPALAVWFGRRCMHKTLARHFSESQTFASEPSSGSSCQQESSSRLHQRPDSDVVGPAIQRWHVT